MGRRGRQGKRCRGGTGTASLTLAVLRGRDRVEGDMVPPGCGSCWGFGSDGMGVDDALNILCDTHAVIGGCVA
ncbi:hypothetical protein KDH_74180 [Dictyobacter sp. S3.2.2.5]|uniref:Aconitase/3-isopropylmalate dehydratase large subunit alpha/beta/alpha domain-containing protein n=1 Tax=Dictyobacter halimunensis TaxID=3026934 RepID=A0ABQ6G246_9CHLR|nr:hypothetical protein KDH_74180 [Dictyobacter sp. S3.2.2.5]